MIAEIDVSIYTLKVLGGNMSFKSIDVSALKESNFTLFDKEWMLITAGEPESYNTMTASWGGLGTLWGKPAAFCFVRPSRHTFSFIEKKDRFSLSFFTEDYRDKLNFCGKNSGRNVNKAKETGFKPVMVSDAVSFEQARLVLVCKKMYTDFFKPENFLDKSIIDEYYPDKDFHKLYVGEVLEVLKKD